ncbi:MAG TPA: succinate dehydrogenase, cytochrome b556 subunit [Gammaproteobacteria bacterium]|nr:succinate dehydrogenase, cytochrome b556 subunit [Gammaproteobacteria bacterium]
MPTQSARPRFLQLLQIRQPITAIVSITHRISGVLLFLALPFAVAALHLSLRSEGDFLQVQAWLATWPVRLIGIVLLWAILHHFLAGIRFLLLDLDIGLSLKAARASAWAVLVAVGLLFVLLLIGALA